MFTLTFRVEPQHVALHSIFEDSEGRLGFYMYIQLEEGIVSLQIVKNALQVYSHFLGTMAVKVYGEFEAILPEILPIQTYIPL